MSFKNKVVVVTGSSSGIGAAIAIQFSKEGADVALVGRNVEKLHKVAKKCEENGKKPLVHVADVSKEEDAQRIIEETVAKYGQLDILINNAGISRLHRLQVPGVMKVFDEVMNVNLRAVVHLTHLAYPHITKVKGNIINISSISGQKILQNQYMFTYTMSKAALDHFTKCCAVEFASDGVRVNAICPGPVITDMVANNSEQNPDEFFARMRAVCLLNRVSEPEEIADLALFLASDKAKAITGTLVNTDNGFLLKGS